MISYLVKLRNNLKANFNRAKKEIALLNLDNLRELTTSSSTTLQMGTTAPNLKATALTKLTTPANNSEQKLFMENLEETIIVEYMKFT
uniref:Bm1291 n=1 Tax=Brugia malayi TaxID=6279 RepID=A0A0J9Y7L7_BRUMA|nr:Bm1291 [Brugia malayi]